MHQGNLSIIFSIELFHINYIESASPHYNSVQLLRVYVLLDSPFFQTRRRKLRDLRSGGLPCPVSRPFGGPNSPRNPNFSKLSRTITFLTLNWVYGIRVPGISNSWRRSVTTTLSVFIWVGKEDIRSSSEMDRNSPDSTKNDNTNHAVTYF